MLDGVLLGQTCEGPFTEIDTGERMLWYSKHMNGTVMKEYKYDPTDSGSSRLVFFALPRYSSHDTHVLACPTLQCWAPLVVMPLRETHPRTACEVPEAAFCSCSLIPGQVVRLLVSSGLTYRCLMSDVSLLKGLDYSCWFLCGVCPVDRSARTDSCLVFARELDWD